MLANARRAWGRLTLAPLPARGPARRSSTRRRTPSTGVEFVQENAPEREELKRELLARAGARGRRRRGLLLVDLRPAARRCCRRTCPTPSGWSSATRSTRSTCCRWSRCAAGERTAPETLARAAAVYRSVGMEPLVLRTEIDGFVADRLLEAMWREALWLVARRRRHGRRDRRRDPARRRPALVVHGHVPDLPHRRRRGGHAPLHRASSARP